MAEYKEFKWDNCVTLRVSPEWDSDNELEFEIDNGDEEESAWLNKEQLKELHAHIGNLLGNEDALLVILHTVTGDDVAKMADKDRSVVRAIVMHLANSVGFIVHNKPETPLCDELQGLLKDLD